MRKIILGNIETVDVHDEELWIGKTSIGRETEKAIEYCFTGKIYYFDYDYEEQKEKFDMSKEKNSSCWLPKSQIEINEEKGYISVPAWLVRKNILNEYILVEGPAKKDLDESVKKLKEIVKI